MLSPNKHTEIKFSVLYVSGLIMQEVRRRGIVKFDDLKESVCTHVNNRLGDTFELALSLLYLQGRVYYNQESDSLVCVAAI